MCGRDRAIGIGVKHMNEIVKVMAEERENGVNSPIAQPSVSISSTVESHQRRSRKDPFVEVVANIGSSLKKYRSFVKEHFTTRKIKSNHNLLVKRYMQWFQKFLDLHSLKYSE